MLDQALEALKSLDWGTDLAPLTPIDDAIRTAHTDPQVQADLEQRLVALLAGQVSRDAQDYICRKLMQVGGAASVPALAGLLSQPETSHMARYALERIPDDAAASALRAALANVTGPLLVGLLSSLGVRGEEASVAAIAGLLGHDDATVARAAAHALGAIRSATAAQALLAAKTQPTAQGAVVDGLLACAEAMLAHKNTQGALAIYTKLMAGDHPKHVKLAATRGRLACAGKKD